MDKANDKTALLETADRRTAAGIKAMVEGDTHLAKVHFEAADACLAKAKALP